MTDVKNSRLYKTLCKAVRRQDHAELLRMLEMVPESAKRGPGGRGMEHAELTSAFWWDETPQGCDYWFELRKRLEEAGHGYW